MCFAHGGEPRRASEIFLRLGDAPAAAAALEKAGDHVAAARIRDQAAGKRALRLRDAARKHIAGKAPLVLEKKGDLLGALHAFIAQKDYANAGRIAFKLGNVGDAAELYEEGGQYLRAAQLLLSLGHETKALEVVTRTPRDSEDYRSAAQLAVRLCHELGVLDFHMDYFVAEFVRSGPQSSDESPLFYALARMYLNRDFPENALEVLQRLVAVDPDYADAERLVHRLEREMRGSAMVYAKITREDAAFRGGGKAPNDFARGPHIRPVSEFPSLPPLDDTPVAPEPGNLREDAAKLATQVTEMTGPGSTSVDAEPPLADDDVRVGALVAGRYRVQAVIGEGGMGKVLRVLDEELNEVVALKFLSRRHTEPEILDRFKRELALSRRLAHPNIVQVYDIGDWHGSKFMSMELLIGEDLSARMTRPMTLEEKIDALRQASAALGAAHRLHVVHRDVKPHNFFVTKSGVVKLIDFGIAKRPSNPKLTKTGFIAGSPDYISPEQINDFANVTYLADIYSLGVIAYEMFTGRVPFQAEDLMPLLMMHVQTPPPSLSSLGVELPRAIEALVLRMLAKAPADRPRSCEEIEVILGRVARSNIATP